MRWRAEVQSGRVLEWWIAAQTLALGLFLLGPGASMTGAAYDYMRLCASEPVFGAMFAAAGAAHLVALAVNGARARATTAVRAVVAAFAVFAWAAFAVGVYQSDPWSTGVATYGGQAVAAAVAVYRATRDALRVRRPAGRGAE
jgi:hypothetical protein